jgi:hypothetical protein
MAWEIQQLQLDFKNNRAMVSLNKQGTPPAQTDWMNVNVNFGVEDADQRKEAETEQQLRARAKQALIEAANSL